MTDHFTIGQLARRTGVPVRTIRFWSDLGIVVPTGRSAGGYRLYDAEAVARLDLVRTLRELGLDLDSVRRIVIRQANLGEVVRKHIAAMDAEMEVLRLRRAVLRSVAERGSTSEELRLMHKLAQLSARERQQIIDDFVAETFRGLPESHLAQAMRIMPDEPSAAQVDAWIELAELVADPTFRTRVRQMAEAGASGPPAAVDATLVMEHADAAVKDGVDPASEAGQEILHRVVGPDAGAELAEQLATFTDRRVERYWELMGILNGRPPFRPATPAFDWVISALRAR